MLDLIQAQLVKHEFGFERLDGSFGLDDRAKALNRFHEDPHCTIMLASIGSAGEG